VKKLVFILITAIFIISGCAPSTPRKPFAEIMELPKEKGVIYIYMPRSKNQSINAIGFIDNADEMGRKFGIRKGHYLPIIASPGETLIRISKKAISVNVAAGETRFVKINSYKTLWWMNFKLTEVDPTAGFMEIMPTYEMQ